MNGFSPDRSHALEVGLRLADAARAITMRYFRQKLLIDDKEDRSPVTVADREAEAAMRDLLRRLRPEDGVLGEEYGNEKNEADYVWVLDPIDGTKSFITGKPLFGVLIALCHHGAPVLGVVDMPALGERFVGADDRGAFLNGTPIRTRSCPSLSQAMLYATSPHMFVGGDAKAFFRLTEAVKHPLYGADCYAYGLLSAGWSDLVVEAGLMAYDFCACAALVVAAGGAVCDWQGQALTMKSAGRVIMAGDKRVLEQTQSLLNGGALSAA